MVTTRLQSITVTLPFTQISNMDKLTNSGYKSRTKNSFAFLRSYFLPKQVRDEDGIVFHTCIQENGLMQAI